jgi:hypothetical protein
MNSIFKMLAAMLIGFASFSSNAAVTCVQNKSTGVYENRVNGSTSDCKFKQTEKSPLEKLAPVGEKYGTVDLTSRQSSTAVNKNKFKALITDFNIRTVLNRWSHEVGMQDVIWQNGDDIPVDRSTEFSSDFGQSVFELMTATGFTKQAARACHHSNGVLRIIPRTKFCDQP